MNEEAVKEILTGEQENKFKNLADEYSCNVPRGSNLKKLLQQHLSKENLDDELKDLVERKLIPLRNSILGTQ